MSATRADGTPIEVLLVEDDPGDVLMTQEAFEEHKVRNRLAVVSTYPCDPPGGAVENRACVRVVELNTTTAASPTLVQDVVVAEGGADLYMGGVGYALNDDLHIVWSRSSLAAGNYPSAYGAYQAAGAANHSISARALMSAGTGTYQGDRWGDFVGVAQDPQVPNAVWQANQYSAGAAFWAVAFIGVLLV